VGQCTRHKQGIVHPDYYPSTGQISCPNPASKSVSLGGRSFGSKFGAWQLLHLDHHQLACYSRCSSESTKPEVSARYGSNAGRAGRRNRALGYVNWVGNFWSENGCVCTRASLSERSALFTDHATRGTIDSVLSMTILNCHQFFHIRYLRSL
jgi:hypothetical protein